MVLRQPVGSARGGPRLHWQRLRAAGFAVLRGGCPAAPASRRGKSARRRLPHGAPSPAADPRDSQPSVGHSSDPSRSGETAARAIGPPPGRFTPCVGHAARGRASQPPLRTTNTGPLTAPGPGTSWPPVAGTAASCRRHHASNPRKSRKALRQWCVTAKYARRSNPSLTLILIPTFTVAVA
jgi:hypothetical protein